MTPEAPKGPKVTLNKGKPYDFTYHDEKSGVAVQARGTLVNWGQSGAQFMGEDGNVHKVPWSALAPKDKEAIQSQPAPQGGVKAGSSKTTKKAAGPILVFAKSEDGGFGEIADVPVVVFAAAVATQGDAEAAAAAPAGDAQADDPGPAEAQPEKASDTRFSYFRHAFQALRNLHW